MLDKAYKLGLKITVTFSYVREYQLKHMEKLLKKAGAVVPGRKHKTGN